MADTDSRIAELAKMLRAQGIASSESMAREMASDIIKTESRQREEFEEKKHDPQVNPQQRTPSAMQPAQDAASTNSFIQNLGSLRTDARAAEQFQEKFGVGADTPIGELTQAPELVEEPTPEVAEPTPVQEPVAPEPPAAQEPEQEEAAESAPVQEEPPEEPVQEESVPEVLQDAAPDLDDIEILDSEPEAVQESAPVEQPAPEPAAPEPAPVQEAPPAPKPKPEPEQNLTPVQDVDLNSMFNYSKR